MAQAANEAESGKPYRSADGETMDINGAKALRRRLGSTEADEALPVVEAPDIPADAPPVYHWTGKTPAETAPETDDRVGPARRASLFSLLSLNLSLSRR